VVFVSAKEISRGALLRTTGWVAAIVVLGGLVLAAGCSSLSKQELEQRLFALEKNAPLRSIGLERAVLASDDGGLPDEVVYLHSPGPPTGSSRLPVVLVHSTPSTLFSWSEVITGGEGFAGLGRNRDVYAIEVVGHGVAPSAPPYGFEQCAAFVSAAIRALGLERVHLVGSSYGGEFCWRAALNDPELVASLTLIDSSGFERADDEWLPEEVQMRENPLANIGWMLNDRERIEGALAPHFREIPPDRVEEFFLVCENPENWRAMVALARDENGERQDELTALEAPTLVLWGGDDVAYPVETYGRRFADAIPRAELVVLPETGHYPHEERPADVVRVLADFFARTEQP
jgi:pimeloyl-ACP methyl ester carboxylesterase